MSAILVDTNILIALFKGDRKIAREIDRYDRINVPTVVIGEFKAGVDMKTSAGKAQDKQLSDFLAFPSVEIVAVSENVADSYSRIFRVLKENGTPIPQNDIWIAACAMETHSLLCSRDSHFSLVPMLKTLVVES